jgi:uncharacterized protein
MSMLPLLIDNVAFAKRNERIEGDFSLENCPRLAELLKCAKGVPESANAIHYALQGKSNGVGQHFLILTINAKLTTICQRCLSEMPLNINLSFNYLIGDISDTDIEALDVDSSDDYDLQQESQVMDVTALIEDEIIIALPIAPMHEQACTKMVMQSGERPNPFDVLKGLIKP